MRISFPVLVSMTACTAAVAPNDGLGGTDFVNDSCVLEVGRCAPDFSLPDTTGALVALSERGGQRVILVGSAMW